MNKKEEKKTEIKTESKVIDVTGKSFFCIIYDNVTKKKDIKISIQPEMIEKFTDNLLYYMIYLNTKHHLEEACAIEMKRSEDKTRYIG